MQIWRNKEGRVRLFWRLAAILISAVVLLVVFTVAGIITAYILGGGIVVLEWLEGYSVHLTVFALLLPTSLFAFVIDKMKFKHMGLSIQGRGTELIFGLLLGGCLVFCLLALHLALGNAKVAEVIWPGALPAVLSGLILYTFVSLSEELLGRGYFLNHFSGRLDLAVASSSLFFVALHLANPGIGILAVINLFLAGVLLALMYLWSGSLWMPMGFHLTWNWVMGSILSYPVSGTEPKGLIRLSIQGNTLLTGGDFGPEGGLPVTVLLILGVLLTRWFLRRRNHACPWRARLPSELTPDLVTEEIQ